MATTGNQSEAAPQSETRKAARISGPQRLSSPQMFLLSMLIFLAIVAFLAAVLFRQFSQFFFTNPGLNGLILGVLLVGVVLTFMQVIGLFREVGWVNSLRLGKDNQHNREPVLLAPMKALIGRRRSVALSTASLRSILDSIAVRLDESRDTSRYLIGLLVFLGLLGTFWGLLQTIGSIGDTIQSLDPVAGGGTGDVLDSLKTGLQAPLAGMGTAFSSSLFGLASSLILGAFDLQASRAQNRFYIELENWLSSITELDASELDSMDSDAGEQFRALVAQANAAQDANPRSAAALANLAEGVAGLVKNMRNEQQMLREWVDEQRNEQNAILGQLARIANSLEIDRQERNKDQ